MKKCSKCSIEQEISNFYNCRKTKDGLANWCKPCTKKIRQQHYTKKKELYLSKAKNWKKENKKKASDINKKSYIKHRDKILNNAKKDRLENPDRYKRISLKYTYNISLEDFNSLLKKQNYVCAICKKIKHEKHRNLYVDHCHKTGKVRGLLCNRCNLGLGNFDDNISNLEEATKYLGDNNENKFQSE